MILVVFHKNGMINSICIYYLYKNIFQVSFFLKEGGMQQKQKQTKTKKQNVYVCVWCLRSFS